MDLVYIVALVVLLVIGAFIVMTRTKQGSQWWLNIRGMINTGAKTDAAQHQKQPDALMEMDKGVGNVMEATKGAKVSMKMKAGKNNKMKVD